MMAALRASPSLTLRGSTTAATSTSLKGLGRVSEWCHTFILTFILIYLGI